MSDHEPNEQVEAPTTPRLVFEPSSISQDTQSVVTNDDIPAFLRKDFNNADPVSPMDLPVYDEAEIPEDAQDAVEQEPESVKGEELPELPEVTEVAEVIEPVADPDVLDASSTEVVETTEVTGTTEDDLSVEELKRREEAIQRRIQEKQKAEKQGVIDQIVAVVKTYNISTEELVEALGGLKIKRKGVKAVPKYRDPATGVTWSGRGKEPAWIKGKDRTPFLIQQGEAQNDDAGTV